MAHNSLTYQLAQMALESQYDRTALCWDITALDYNDDTFWGDIDLHERVSLLFLEDEALWEEAWAAPEEAEYEIEQVKALYTFHLLIARLVFRNDPVTSDALQLLGKREESLQGWTAQATRFYQNLRRLSPAMATYGIALSELRQAKAMVEAVVERYLF